MSTITFEKRRAAQLTPLNCPTSDPNAVVLIVTLGRLEGAAFTAATARLQAEGAAVYAAELCAEFDSAFGPEILRDLLAELRELRQALAADWPSVPLILVAVGRADVPVRQYADLFPDEVQAIVVVSEPAAA